MNDREKWRERIRDIRACSTTWWWWWWLMVSKDCLSFVVYQSLLGKYFPIKIGFSFLFLKYFGTVFSISWTHRNSRSQYFSYNLIKNKYFLQAIFFLSNQLTPRQVDRHEIVFIEGKYPQMKTHATSNKFNPPSRYNLRGKALWDRAINL